MLANRDQDIIVFKKLNPKDVTVTPFKTYKEWNVISANSASYGITIKNGIYDSSIGIDCKLDKMVVDTEHLNYIGIKRLFYDEDKFNPHITTGRSGEYLQTRELNGNIKIISVPELTFGEKIKPGSVELYQGNSQNTYYDDSNGNLYYTPYTSSIVSSDMLLSYINFNELYTPLSNLLYSGSINDEWNFRNTISGSNLLIENGKYGKGISLNSTSSYMQITHTDELNFDKYDNYSLSFWLKVPVTHSLQKYDIISKFGNNIYAGYPYRIMLDTNNDINFSISDDNRRLTLTGSLTVNDNTYHHIVCQRSESKMLMYYDGTFQASSSFTADGNIHNTSDIFIGTNGLLGNFLSASIDEFRIYNRALTATEVNNLYTLPNNSARVGNVFYEYGKIILTHPSSSFIDLYGDFNLFFKGQHTIYEREILCVVKDTEYNYSMNDTLRLTERESDDRMKWFVNETSQSFSPYVTTIGLYNDKQQLLAIAKLARPIRSEKNSDLTFAIRLDF